MESSSKTRYAQKQYIDFMVNAGCDPNLISQDYPIDLSPTLNVLKKPTYKQIHGTQDYSYDTQRHKKIHKSTKKT